MIRESKKAVLKAIRSHVPAGKLTNDDLAQEFQDWDVNKRFAKTGIAIRGIAAAEECASDLGVAAANKLFADGIVESSKIDYLIFCTQSPDYYLPASACLIQHRLGLSTSCGAVDINQGCSGYVYGLSLAKGLVESQIARNVLLITAETYSKHIHPKDRSVRTIFGDGAAASWITGVPTDEESIGPFVLGTNGAGADELIVPAGGFRNPIDEASSLETVDGAGNVRSRRNLYMNGAEIFTFTLKTVPSLVNSLLQRAGMDRDDVSYYIFHQANKYMLEELRRKIGIFPDRFCINMENYGNTVSATIPMALEIACASGSVQSGDAVMLVGFGVGYSWGACMVKVP